MRTLRGTGSRVAGTIRPVAWGLGVTLPVLGFFAATAATPYSSPGFPLLALLGVVFISHLWGVLAGMGSALAAWVTALAYFSKDGQFLAFDDESAIRIAVLGITTPAAAMMVGYFKRQADRQEAMLANQAELLELADEAIIVRDLAGRITYWNDGAQALFGWSAAEAIGQHCEQLLQTRSAISHDAVVKALLEHGRWDGEVEHARQGGGRLVVESRQALQLTRDDRPAAILEIARDITRSRQDQAAAREAETRFKALAEASFEGIAVGEGGTILVANRPMAAMFGYEESEMIGMLVSELVSPESRFAVADRVGTESETPLEVLAVRRDGSTFPAEIQSKSAVFAGGSGVVIALRDITARKDVEKLKDQVFGLVSHDLRNPVVAIWMALDAALNGVLGEVPGELRPILASARERSTRLLKLTEDLLESERMAVGLIKLEMSRTGARRLLDAAVAAIAPQAAAEGRLIEIAGEDLEIQADEVQLLRVLENLLGNAIKFSPPGSGLHLASRREGDFAAFSVRDEGPGIPADKLEAVFERFQRLDADYGSTHEGHGLGLSICRTIVGLHGGRIWAESTQGAGSTFRFVIPLDSNRGAGVRGRDSSPEDN